MVKLRQDKKSRALLDLAVRWCFALVFLISPAASANESSEWDFVLRHDLGRVASGGEQTGGFNLWNLDTKLALDTEAAGFWRGGTFFLYFLVNQGEDPSELAGDRQVLNNLEAQGNISRLYEAWYQHTFFSQNLSLLVGLHDLNSEFYATASSALFINSSFGIGHELAQTGVNGPSIFPVTAPAIRLRMSFYEKYELLIGLYSAVSGHPDHPQGTHIVVGSDEGALAISEVAWIRQEHTENQGSLDKTILGKVALGVWTYSKQFETLDGQSQSPNFGAYLLLDQKLFATTSAYLRAGFASPEVNETYSNIAFGLNVKSPFPQRSEDEFGIGVSLITPTPSHESIESTDEKVLTSHETVLEWTYRYVLNTHLAFQPNVQYILNPNFSRDLDPALSLLIRSEFSF